jgi:hypothetical protein
VYCHPDFESEMASASAEAIGIFEQVQSRPAIRIENE